MALAGLYLFKISDFRIIWSEWRVGGDVLIREITACFKESVFAIVNRVFHFSRLRCRDNKRWECYNVSRPFGLHVLLFEGIFPPQNRPCLSRQNVVNIVHRAIIGQLRAYTFDCLKAVRFSSILYWTWLAKTKQSI